MRPLPPPSHTHTHTHFACLRGQGRLNRPAGRRYADFAPSLRRSTEGHARRGRAGAQGPSRNGAQTAPGHRARPGPPGDGRRQERTCAPTGTAGQPRRPPVAREHRPAAGAEGRHKAPRGSAPERDKKTNTATRPQDARDYRNTSGAAISHPPASSAWLWGRTAAISAMASWSLPRNHWAPHARFGVSSQSCTGRRRR